MKVFGVTGWKNMGKTTLTERLVTHFSEKGLTVSTVKHAHHDTEIDHPGRDSHRHRSAGAQEVAIVSPNRWAIINELRGAPEPSLENILSRLSPADLVLIEGYKRLPHPKIEVYRPDAAKFPPLALDNPTIRAVASTGPAEVPCPILPLDEIATIARFIRQECGL